MFSLELAAILYTRNKINERIDSIAIEGKIVCYFSLFFFFLYTTNCIIQREFYYRALIRSKRVLYRKQHARLYWTKSISMHPKRYGMCLSRVASGGGKGERVRAPPAHACLMVKQRQFPGVSALDISRGQRLDAMSNSVRQRAVIWV